jgi:hypothetical protein
MGTQMQGQAIDRSLGNVQLGYGAAGAMNQLLGTGMALKYPPLGQTSMSTGQSTGSSASSGQSTSGGSDVSMGYGYSPYNPLGVPGGKGSPWATPQGVVRTTGIGPQMQTGGDVDYDESPSGGTRVDDVPANLTAGEFVIPKDVTEWKGQEFFYKLMAQARKTRAMAGSNGQTGYGSSNGNGEDQSNGYQYGGRVSADDRWRAEMAEKQRQFDETMRYKRSQVPFHPGQVVGPLGSRGGSGWLYGGTGSPVQTFAPSEQFPSGSVIDEQGNQISPEEHAIRLARGEAAVRGNRAAMQDLDDPNWVNKRLAAERPLGEERGDTPEVTGPAPPEQYKPLGYQSYQYGRENYQRGGPAGLTREQWGQLAQGYSPAMVDADPEDVISKGQFMGEEARREAKMLRGGMRPSTFSPAGQARPEVQMEEGYQHGGPVPG